MQVQKLNNQPSFGMRFYVSENVHKEFISKVEKTLVEIKSQGGNDAPDLVSMAKSFLTKFYRNMLEHNANKANHSVYNDEIKIESMSIVPEKSEGEKGLHRYAYVVQSTKGTDGFFAVPNSSELCDPFREQKENIVSKMQKDLIIKKSKDQKTVDNDLAYLLDKVQPPTHF